MTSLCYWTPLSLTQKFSCQTSSSPLSCLSCLFLSFQLPFRSPWFSPFLLSLYLPLPYRPLACRPFGGYDDDVLPQSFGEADLPIQETPIEEVWRVSWRLKRASASRKSSWKRTVEQFMSRHRFGPLDNWPGLQPYTDARLVRGILVKRDFGRFLS